MKKLKMKLDIEKEIAFMNYKIDTHRLKWTHFINYGKYTIIGHSIIMNEIVYFLNNKKLYLIKHTYYTRHP